MLILTIHHHHYAAPGGDLAAALQPLKDLIMKTQSELAASLAEITTKVDKVGTETRALLQRIDDLTAAIENQDQVSEEVEAAVAALKAQVDVVDQLVPDAAPEEPADPAQG